jgi:hypothetical protein
VSTPPRRPGATQVLRPKLLEEREYNKAGELAPLNEQKTAEAQLSEAHKAEIDEYFDQHSKANVSALARRFVTRYGGGFSTWHRKIGDYRNPK